MKDFLYGLLVVVSRPYWLLGYVGFSEWPGSGNEEFSPVC